MSTERSILPLSCLTCARQLWQQQEDKLSLAKWHPARAGTYPNRPPSPGRHRSHDPSVRGFNPKKKVGKWVGSSGRGGSSAISAMMRGENPSASRQRSIPGLRPGASIPGLPAAANASGKGRGGGKKTRSRKKKKNTDETPAAAPAPASAPAAASEAPPAAGDAAKLMKKLSKKLRQIETLKERKQKGEKMSEQQMTKMNLEPSIRKQIAELKI